MFHRSLNTLRKVGEVTFWLAVVCALLFSMSGWQVEWLKESFSSAGQLVFRAASALLISGLWFGLMSLINRNKNKTEASVSASDFNTYSKKMLVLTVLCRPIFNLCFILSITKETATVALMILLFVKMLTNVLFNAFEKDLDKRKLPTKKEWIGYAVVTLGILIYGADKPSVFSWVLLFAVVSGFLEGLRLELIKRLDVKPAHKPVFSLFEFSGMLVVALILLAVFMLSGGTFLAVDFNGITDHSLFSMLTLPLTSVIILGLDYYIAPKMPTGRYSAILATELGFAGVLNWRFLGSDFGWFQIAGLVISMVAIILIKYSSDKKK